MRKVRVSVQKDVGSTRSAWGTDPDWVHVRYQQLDLYPMSMEETARFSGVGFDANWKAIVHQPTPIIKDNYRLVYFTAERGEIILNVVKANPRGRVQEILLKEIGAEQPQDA